MLFIRTNHRSLEQWNINGGRARIFQEDRPSCITEAKTNEMGAKSPWHRNGRSESEKARDSSGHTDSWSVNSILHEQLGMTNPTARRVPTESRLEFFFIIHGNDLTYKKKTQQPPTISSPPLKNHSNNINWFIQVNCRTCVQYVAKVSEDETI